MNLPKNKTLISLTWLSFSLLTTSLAYGTEGEVEALESPGVRTRQSSSPQSPIGQALSQYSGGSNENQDRKDQLDGLLYVPNDLPACHHYFLAQRFQGFISEAYSKLEGLRDQRDQRARQQGRVALDELQVQLTKHQNNIKDLEQRINIQKKFLEEEEPEKSDKEFIIGYLKEIKGEYEKKISEAETEVEKSHFEEELKETQEQIRAFEFSVAAYERQIKGTRKLIEKLEDEIKLFNSNTINDEGFSTALKTFNTLASIKVKTTYNLERAGIKNGSLFEEDDIKNLLNEVINISESRLKNLDSSFLYNFFVSRLEFPDPVYLDRDSNFLKRYQDQIKVLHSHYNYRLQEDVFSFDLVAPLIDLRSLKLEEYNRLAEEFSQKASIHSSSNIFGSSSPFMQSGFTEDRQIFGTILKHYGSQSTQEILDAWSEVLLEKIPGCLLGQLLVGLKLEAVFSWQKADEAALHVQIRNRLTKDPKADVSKEMMKLVHRILNRHMSRGALRFIGTKLRVNWDEKGN